MTSATGIVVSPPRKLPTFQTWKAVPEGFASRHQWLKEGRKLKLGEAPSARWIKTSPRDATDPLFTLAAGDGVLYADDEFALVIETEVLLFHISQTQPAPLQPRTLAYMDFEDIFLESARKDSFIVWDFEKESWQTRTAFANASEYWQRGLLSNDLIRRHLNQREIVGIKGGPQTRFVALDHDFHGRDRSVYLGQAEALLGLLHGNGWHYQVAREDIEGVHYFLVFHDFLDLAQVRAVLRKALVDLDKSHPDLANRAKAAGMKTLADLEIYPDADQGFRLPLSKGRQMLLDRPLPLLTYRKRTVQDVIGYMNWLNDPQRQYMSREAVYTYLFMNLASSRSKATRTTSKPKTVQQGAPSNPTELGSLNNCCRQKITGFFNGTFNPPNCLNTVIAVSARIMLFQDVDEGSAVDVLGQYVRDIPDHAKDCSRRLAEGDFRNIDRDIQRAVKMAYAANGGQKDVALSDNKLQKAVQCWQNAGFELADKSTWANCWARFSLIPDIEWTAEDKSDIDRVLGPVLSRNHSHIAKNVAQGMVKMAAVKHGQQNGMTYGYWGDFLGDEYGVSCGNRNKVRAILAAGLNLDLIEVQSKALWFNDHRRGFATIYRPGERVSSRLLLGR